MKLEGKVTDAKYAYQRKAYVKPVEHHYEDKGEKPYIKYGCPVCEMLENIHQIGYLLPNCFSCGVNLTWDDQIENMWDALADAPFDEDVEFQELYLSDNWLHFKEGTYREHIWKWFDSKHSKGLAYLMHEREKE